MNNQILVTGGAGYGESGDMTQFRQKLGSCPPIPLSRAGYLPIAFQPMFNATGANPDGETGEDHTQEKHPISLVRDAALGSRLK